MGTRRRQAAGVLRGAMALAAFALWSRVAPVDARAGASGTVLYRGTFAGGRAEGWELEPGWEVKQYQRGRWALHGRGHKWARYGGGTWSDYDLSLYVSLVQGQLHINYRLGEGGRYFIGLREGWIGLQKTSPPGRHFPLRSRKAPVKRNRWHHVRIAGRGNQLSIYLDGALQIGFQDPRPLLRGGIALETLEGSEVYVTGIVVSGQARPAQRAVWVRTGGPMGGLGYDVRIHPMERNLLYVSDAWAGVYISTDGGRAWRAANQGIITRIGPSGDRIPIFCLTIDPHNPSVLWAGTTDKRGIYKSINGGRNWMKMDAGVVEKSGITFRGFTVDPVDANVVYAAGEISSYAWAGKPRSGREFDLAKGVIYKTTNGGQRWTAVWRGDSLARYVWIHPRKRNLLYVSTGIFDREAANSEPRRNLPGGLGVLKSIDGGRTWRVLGRQNGLKNLYIGSLFMHPRDPNTLLAGAGNNAYPEGSGAFLSTDGGETWKQTLAGDEITAVEFALSEPRIAYAGSVKAVYRSDDGGLSWRTMTQGGIWGPPGVRAGFPIDFQVDPRNPNRLFANNYGGGNFLSEDGGRSWRMASQGYTGAGTRAIAVDPTNGRRVFAAGRSGVFMSPNGGAEWVGLNHPPVCTTEWYAIAVHPSNPQHLLAANNCQRAIVRSDDGGRSWHHVSGKLAARTGWRAIAFAPSAPHVVYAGTSAFLSAGTFHDPMAAAGIYASKDGGGHWQPANDPTSAKANVAALAVHPREPHVVYAATTTQGVLKSENGGRAWRPLTRGLRVRDARALAIDSTHPQRVYVGMENAGLYMSEDGGERWVHRSAGMDAEAAIHGIVIHPRNPRLLFAGDFHGGVYRSADGGERWVKINQGLRTRAVQALALSTDGRTLYAATEGEGVFRLDLKLPRRVAEP